ncbi:MAG: ABC transporter substrate-binding protein [Sphaerochaetaceae bacterium]|nr:ABC transporter substrate-binding protein [Sphaerochaetaceae bacterium]
MKKIVAVFVVLSVFTVSVFAFGNKETGTVNLAVMQGPTGFSGVFLDDFVNVSVYPSPAEIVSKIVSGELDMAVVPANYAAAFHNRDYEIKAVAVVGEGMLSVIGTDENADTISIPGAAGTPAHMAALLYEEYAPDYSVTAPAQLAQMLIAGKRTLAIMPQPFVSMVTAKNPEIRILSDVQQKWKEKTGSSQYPMSILIVRENFYRQYKDTVEAVKQSYRKSVEKVLSDPEAAAKEIEKQGIMKADLAVAAIPDCALVFKDLKKKTVRRELSVYYETLLRFVPDAIGGKMPADTLYE